MIVCSCNVLSDTKIRASVNDESCLSSPGAVYRCLGCTPNCGRCFKTIRSIITATLAENAAKQEMCDRPSSSGGSFAA